MNPRRFTIALLLIISLLSTFSGTPLHAAGPRPITVYFSPDGGCTDEIVRRNC